MEKDFIEYKGWKIQPCLAGFSLWGKSPYYPIDTCWVTTKKLNECKKWARTYCETLKVKKWRTVFDHCITKDVIRY